MEGYAGLYRIDFKLLYYRLFGAVKRIFLADVINDNILNNKNYFI